MSERTGIEWCDSTFNPWIGCTKVSPGCDHCYAERDMDIRRHRVKWGAGQERSRTSEAYWKQPRRWQAGARLFKECTACGYRGELDRDGFCAICAGEVRQARRRVFCASLADVFDNEVDPAWRADLFALIRATPDLDWLMLTKRIGNAKAMLPQDWGFGYSNVWLGATVVNQAEAERDVRKLIDTPAQTRFLSCEPLLGPIDLTCDGLVCGPCPNWPEHPMMDPTTGTYECCSRCDYTGIGDEWAIDWIIAGGESGPRARPSHPDWYRSIRDQCAAASVPFLFKQWGEFASVSEVAGAGAHHIFPDGATVRRVGKKLAGRTLDGATYSEFPRMAA